MFRFRRIVRQLFVSILVLSSLSLISTPASAGPAASITVAGSNFGTGAPTTVGISLAGFDETKSYQVTVKFVNNSTSADVTNGTLVATQGGTSLISGYTSYSAAKLGFTGTYADIATALSSITWSPAAASGDISIRVGVASTPGANAYYDANSTHYYKYFSTPATWADARTAAENSTLFGLQGYLAEITSASENTFVGTETAAQNIWIGAREDTNTATSYMGYTYDGTDGQKWIWNGAVQSPLPAGTGASALGAGIFSSWATGEPNNDLKPGQDCAVTNWYGAAGKWNDLNCLEPNGYLVEYGGRAEETTTATTVTLTKTVTAVGAALTPSFGSPTATADGFSVPITNYSTSYTWETPTVTASGSVAVTYGSVWSTNSNSSGLKFWTGIASSSNGAKLAAVADSQKIRTSTDSGVTWTEQPNSATASWTSIASSSDGSKLAAVAYEGAIYTSTDSGVTWTARENESPRNWISITSSSDGVNLAAAVLGGAIYASADSGVTWTAQTNAGVRDWASITSNSDGSKLAAVTRSTFDGVGGVVYTSTDSGVNWTAQTNAGARDWISVTSSSNGTKLAAVVYNGSIYTSSDSGVTWTAQTNAGSRNWASITSSSDGTKLAAGVVNTGYIYTSTNSGVTWTAQTNAGLGDWGAIASSSDGKFAAANFGLPSGGAISTTTPVLLVTGLAPGTSATITQTTSRVGYANGSNTVTGTAITGAALTPTFSTPVSTADGFTVTATNYDSSYTWDIPTVSAGSVAVTYGTAWSTKSNSSPNTSWTAIASSSDGTKLVASGGGFIYTSVNSGATWTQRTSGTARFYRSIASSSDGSYLAASHEGGFIYTSTDYGVSWTQRATSRSWVGITSSGDGSKLAAVIEDGPLFTSTDYGVTWTEQTGAANRYWQGITSSSDGATLAAVVLDGGIHTSSNYGVSWTQTAAPRASWSAIASSNNGSKLVAVQGGLGPGYIYTSSNYGVSWTVRANDTTREWRRVVSSSDGTKLAAIVFSNTLNGYIYTSEDSGVTWTGNLTDISRRWQAIASSSDGTKLAAGGNFTNSYIYTRSVVASYTVTGLAQAQSAIITQTTSRSGYTNGSNTVTGSARAESTISTANVAITAPVTGATPVSSLTSNGQYTTAITWNGSPATFASNTTYTATVTVTPISGYTLAGVAANFFTVNSSSATSGNLINAGSFTKTFPVTATTISTAAIAGITTPATGDTPVTSTSGVQYNTTITWSAVHPRFRSTTVYTATITLTPNTGYTLTGVTANFFTVSGATSVTHSANSGTITAVFPATGGKLSQTITFNTPAGMTRVSPNQSLTPTTTATGGYGITLTSTTATCSISGSAVVQSGLGICSITASQAGDEIYSAATSVSRSFNIIKAAQVISMNTPAAMVKSSLDQTLVATSSAALSPLSFFTTTPTRCEIVSVNGVTKVRVKTSSFQPGVCSVSASHAGTLIYASASTSRSFVISKDPQTITFTQPTAMTRATADQILVATSSASFSSIAFTSNTLSICTIVTDGQSTKVRTVAPGTCSITASRVGEGDIATGSATRTFVISKKSQTISFTQPINMKLTDADQVLTATTSAGLTTTFSSQSPSVCSVVNGKIHPIGPGYCHISANQSGDTDTAPASRAIKTILIRRS
jgi:photosystem II stability/assembly factor-like uncharacterized protein